MKHRIKQLHLDLTLIAEEYLVRWASTTECSGCGKQSANHVCGPCAKAELARRRKATKKKPTVPDSRRFGRMAG
jgi:hypothetical protein